MIGFLFALLPTFAELYLVNLYVHLMIDNSRKIALKNNIYTLIIGISFTLGKLIIKNNLFQVIVTLLITFLFLLFSNKYKVKELLPAYIISSVLIIFIIEIPIVGLLSKYNSEIIFPLICGILILTLGLLFSTLLPLHKLYIYIENASTQIYLILMNILVLIIVVVFYFQTERNNFYESIILLLSTSILLIAINSIIYTSYIRRIEKDKRLKLLEDYIPILDEMILSVREKQHNYNDKLQAITSLPYKYDNYDSLANALTGEDFRSLFTSTPAYLLKLNLTIVAGYLFQKVKQAEKDNKYIDINIYNYNLPDVIPQHEIIELLGVLIDNSLEAIPRNASIHISIDKTEENKIIISTANQGPEVNSAFLVNIFTTGYTTKIPKKERGLGLPKLKKYVDNKGGKITVYNETIDGVRNIVFKVEV